MNTNLKRLVKKFERYRSSEYLGYDVFIYVFCHKKKKNVFSTCIILCYTNDTVHKPTIERAHAISNRHPVFCVLSTLFVTHYNGNIFSVFRYCFAVEIISSSCFVRRHVSKRIESKRRRRRFLSLIQIVQRVWNYYFKTNDRKKKTNKRYRKSYLLCSCVR